LDHIDYDDGQKLWVGSMVAQVQSWYPTNEGQWGETHPLVQPRVNETQTEFEDVVRALLALLDRQGGGRLQNLVANFHVARQAVVDQAAREKSEATTAAQQTAKALEEERARAEKATPTFAEHELIELIDDLRKKTGYQVFPIQIDNAPFVTQLYDFMASKLLRAQGSH